VEWREEGKDGSSVPLIKSKVNTNEFRQNRKVEELQRRLSGCERGDIAAPLKEKGLL